MLRRVALTVIGELMRMGWRAPVGGAAILGLQPDAAFGHARYVVNQLRKDPSWVVVDDLKTIEAELEKYCRLIILGFSHTHDFAMTNRVTLRLQDVTGVVATLSDSASTGWTPAGDVRKAINGALRQLKSLRPRYDAAVETPMLARLRQAERTPVPVESILRRFKETPEEVTSIEGVWTESEGEYKTAITNSPTDPSQFLMVVVASKNPFWSEGMIKAKLTASAVDGVFVARYLAWNHAEVGATATIKSGAVLLIPLKIDNKENVVTFLKTEPARSVPAAAAGGESMKAAVRPAATGTGFVCGLNLIATNYHVIRGAKRLEVVFPSSPAPYSLELVSQDRASQCLSTGGKV